MYFFRVQLFGSDVKKICMELHVSLHVKRLLVLRVHVCSWCKIWRVHTLVRVVWRECSYVILYTSSSTCMLQTWTKCTCASPFSSLTIALCWNWRYSPSSSFLTYEHRRLGMRSAGTSRVFRKASTLNLFTPFTIRIASLADGNQRLKSGMAGMIENSMTKKISKLKLSDYDTAEQRGNLHLHYPFAPRVAVSWIYIYDRLERSATAACWFWARGSNLRDSSRKRAHTFSFTSCFFSLRFVRSQRVRFLLLLLLLLHGEEESVEDCAFRDGGVWPYPHRGEIPRQAFGVSSSGVSIRKRSKLGLVLCETERPSDVVKMSLPPGCAQIYHEREMLQAKVDLLASTKMVDFAVEVYHQLHPDQDPPEGKALSQWNPLTLAFEFMWLTEVASCAILLP